MESSPDREELERKPVVPAQHDADQAEDNQLGLDDDDLELDDDEDEDEDVTEGEAERADGA